MCPIVDYNTRNVAMFRVLCVCPSPASLLVSAGALLSLAFVHNIIRRHPACMVLLHKPSTAAAAAGSNAGDTTAAAAAAAAGVDVYDPSEADPGKSRAVESSLWEIEALRNHASPQVREGGHVFCFWSHFYL